MSRELPFEPLRSYLRISRELDFVHVGLPSLGWVKGTWQARAWDEGRKHGGFTVVTADRLACDLRTHPSSIWGDVWWDDGEPEPPPRVLCEPKLTRLGRELYSARLREKRARAIPRVSAEQLVSEFNAAYPESPLVKAQRLHDLVLEENAWVARQPGWFRALGGPARYDATGRPGIPTQRPAPDHRQATAV